MTADDRPERDAIPEAFRWNLCDLFATDEDCRAAIARLAEDVREFPRFKDDCGRSATSLADALEERSRIQRSLYRVLAYARLQTCEDARNARAEALLHAATQVAADFRDTTLFLESALVELGAATTRGFVAAEPRLAVYRTYLEDCVVRADHVLSEREERILVSARQLARAAYGAYHVFANIEFQYPEVTFSDGRRVRVDSISYAELRGTAEQRDRRRVATAFFTALGAYERTFAALLGVSIQRAQFEAECRHYRSSFELALADLEVPGSVYTDLIAAVNAHLPVLHRYLTVRRRVLELDPFHYFDLYAPLDRQRPREHTLDEACQLVVDAMAPLGNGYVTRLRRALTDRWVDFLPNSGKSPDAFTNGAAYDVHPYALLNFQGTYQDVSTLAHELGHVLHAVYTNKHQPFPLAGQHGLIAEVAATFNEALLIRHMLAACTSDDERRLAYLDHFLERIRTTVFRQVCFGEFAMLMHDMARRNVALTGESLSREYLALVRRYYGHDAGACQVDPWVGHEWIDIPHLRGTFSVLNYPVSFIAAFVLADQVYRGDADARDAYLELLAAGSSRGPLELLVDAGVDVRDSALFTRVLKSMDVMTTEMEDLGTRRGASLASSQITTARGSE